jgi:hypothetical protein
MLFVGALHRARPDFHRLVLSPRSSRWF